MLLEPTRHPVQVVLTNVLHSWKEKPRRSDLEHGCVLPPAQQEGHTPRTGCGCQEGGHSSNRHHVPVSRTRHVSQSTKEKVAVCSCWDVPAACTCTRSPARGLPGGPPGHDHPCGNDVVLQARPPTVGSTSIGHGVCNDCAYATALYKGLHVAITDNTST